MHGQSKSVLSEKQDQVPGVHDESFLRFGEIPPEGLDAIRHPRPWCGGELGLGLMPAILHLKCKIAGETASLKKKWSGRLGGAQKKGDPVENIITSCGPVSLLRRATTHHTADGAAETH
jgi:hypothetical protein